MTWIDILIFILLAGGLTEGFLRGFIREVVGVVSVAVGIYFTRLFGADAALWVEEAWKLSPMIAEAVAYALLFTIVSFAVSLLARLLREFIKQAQLSRLNRFLGAIAGLIKGAFVALIIVFAIGRIDEAKPILSDNTRNNSLLYTPTYNLANDCLSITRSQFGATETDDTEGY